MKRLGLSWIKERKLFSVTDILNGFTERRPWYFKISKFQLLQTHIFLSLIFRLTVESWKNVVRKILSTNIYVGLNIRTGSDTRRNNEVWGGQASSIRSINIDSGRRGRWRRAECRTVEVGKFKTVLFIVLDGIYVLYLKIVQENIMVPVRV